MTEENKETQPTTDPTEAALDILKTVHDRALVAMEKYVTAMERQAAALEERNKIEADRNEIFRELERTINAIQQRAGDMVERGLGSAIVR